jgi:hypothetical protein
VGNRLGKVVIGTMRSTYGPTPNLERTLALAEEQFGDVRERFIELTESRIPAFERRLAAAGAPWVPGMPLSALETSAD